MYFTCKGNTYSLKLQLSSPEAFRNTINIFKSINIDFHTYQIKEKSRSLNSPSHNSLRLYKRRNCITWFQIQTSCKYFIMSD